VSKQKYHLEPAELTAILKLFEAQQNPSSIWQSVCKRLNCRMDTIEDAKSGNPHEFLAEPNVPAPSSDVRRGHTSASNAEADLRCPGRHLAQAGIPEPVKGEDAMTGTRIHAALAGEDTSFPASLSVSERESFDACREIEKKLVDSFFGPAASRMVVKRHVRYWGKFEANGVQYEHSGEADVVWRAGDKALILDFKVLAGDVAENPRNMQLRDLACLVYGNVPLLESVGVAIVQPLVTHSPVVCQYSIADLKQAETEMVARVILSNTPGSPRVADEAVQCKHCKAKATCVEYSRLGASRIPVVAEPVQQALLFQVAMANWTKEQRALACSIVPIAVKRLEEIKEYLKGLLSLDPSAIPGWGLSDGRVSKPVVNPQVCFDRFAALGGKLPDFLECIDVVKGRLEEKVSKVTDSKGKALKTQLTALYEGITEEKRSQPSLERVGEK